MPALLLSLMLFQAAALGPKPPAPPPPSPADAAQIAQPVWVAKPSAEDLAALYPRAAVDAGVEGRATMRCTVTAVGLLTGCEVVVQDPPEAGFGQAALAMAGKFQMAPKTRDGQPVEGGTVRIPIRFLLPRPSDAEPAGTTPAVIRPVWTKKPSDTDVARAYPRRAKGASGDVRLRCVIAANGRFDSCDVIEESPGNLGFGAAGLEVAKQFQLAPVDGDGGKVAGRAIRIPIKFVAPAR